MASFLDLIGLTHFWSKAKTYIDSAISTAKTAVGNYTINGKKISTNPSISKSDVGLSNVTNDAQVKRSEMGVANGVATLNGSGFIPASQLPGYVDDMLEFDSAVSSGTFASNQESISPVMIYYLKNSKKFAASSSSLGSGSPTNLQGSWSENTNYRNANAYGTPSQTGCTPKDGVIYVDKSTGKTYRWSGSDLVEISSSLALGETSSTAYPGDKGAKAYAHAVTNKGNAFQSGLYKITTNAEGHVTAATAVTKTDITALGIPGQDTNTTYGSISTSEIDGIFS